MARIFLQESNLDAFDGNETFSRLCDGTRKKESHTQADVVEKRDAQENLLHKIDYHMIQWL